MKNKFLIFGVFFLILLLAVAVVIKLNINRQAVNNNLNTYGSENIPEECRLPQGQDLQSWKEHLGHHQQTLYCLDYYK